MTHEQIAARLFACIGELASDPHYADILRDLRYKIDAELARIYAALPYHVGDAGDRRGVVMPRRKG